MSGAQKFLLLTMDVKVCTSMLRAKIRNGRLWVVQVVTQTCTSEALLQFLLVTLDYSYMSNSSVKGFLKW